MNHPLTCESCKHSPATHLLVVDLKSRRIESMSCEHCGYRDMNMIKDMGSAYAGWLFRLMPELRTPGAPQE